ncbi:cyclin-dependent kinase 18 [Gracilinanus agilis]|uniref:cyclin-dependent kinase 18 n=1 Tax=Gracilinanus agilis TaxID=191870 RepID=UPI001CFC62DA|nr:cyclin-dependent kinase 18 [Gracilinanus agilis]
MNKMKNFKRRFSLSVPRTETIEESLAEFTEQFNQLNSRRSENLAQGHLQLGPLVGDFQPEPSAISPSEEDGDSQGQSSPGIRYRKHNQRRFSMEDVSKRLSLPMDIRLPPEFLQKLQLESPELPKPLSRMSRRASLSDIGFGKLETYVKLDKLAPFLTVPHRGVGCIHYEMATGRPMFPGSTVKEELHLIFRLLGTPTEESWPGVTSLPEFRAYNFPPYKPQPLINNAPRLDTDGIDLLTSLLLYEAKSRISAEEALRHSYFGPLGERVHQLPDTASIFSLKEIQLQKDPGYRGLSFQQTGRGKNRRQSIF